MTRVNKTIPKTPRELEQFYRDLIVKVADTDITLSDEEQKSTIPFLGMVQAAQRQIDSLMRQIRRQEIQIAALKRRVAQIEGEL